MPNPLPPRSVPRRAIAGWLLFDWAAQPFFTLVTTFVYAPYFAASIAADPVQGQALWGFATAGAGLCIALLSPVLGAIADAGGRRKPWIAAFGALLVIASAALWLGRPGDASMIVFVLAAFALGTIGVEFATVFTNAMMPSLVPPHRLGRLSGTGWATGYVGGLVSLMLTLGFLADKPRASGLLTAIWFIVFVLPLFAFTPDQPKKRPLRAAAVHGLATLAATIRALPSHRNVARFLLANMVYTDGLVALFAFGGIYAVGIFGWSTTELAIFGILLTITGTLGAWLGGKLDDRLGSKFVIVGALIILIIAAVAILSIDRDAIAFVPVAPPAPNDGLYAAPAEQVYVALGLFIGLAAGPLQAASRSLLARLAPAERTTQFFGLFALSGKVTSFLGPLLVGVVTAATASQKAGMAVLIAFFVVGVLLLCGVHIDSSPASREEGATSLS